jgi:hypothetical protein
LGVAIDPAKMERLAANMKNVKSRKEALLRWEPGYRRGRW